MKRSELLASRCIIPVGRTFAVVDPIDYDLAMTQVWKLGRSGKNRAFAYCFYKNADGFQKWYLHHFVATRAYGPRPSKEHLCQALDGDPLDCRRENLRWRDKMGMKLEAMRAGAAKARANA
jgi:hypothetical protein